MIDQQVQMQFGFIRLTDPVSGRKFVVWRLHDRDGNTVAVCLKRFQDDQGHDGLKAATFDRDIARTVIQSQIGQRPLDELLEYCSAFQGRNYDEAYRACEAVASKRPLLSRKVLVPGGV